MEEKIYLPSNVQMDKMNNFKLMEKKYRFYEGKKTNFSDVIDFNDPSLDLTKHNISMLSLKGHKTFKLGFPGGVYIIKNALSIEKQMEVVLECMNIYVNRPYRTNLFIYEEDTDWKTTYDPSKKLKKSEGEETVKETIITEEESTLEGSKPSAPEEGLKKESIASKSVEKSESKSTHSKLDSSFASSTGSKEYAVDKFVVNDFNKFHFNKKVRWSNVGAQYDWDNRKYPSFKTPMPKIIDELSQIARNLTEEEIPDIDDYEAEAVIVNYYDKKNYMSGHLDDGENDQKSPIFSFTFGCSCVFLMGDKTKDFIPLPLKLDAGDLMVMSGYSRNCYHGVPRIMTSTFPKAEWEAKIKEMNPEIYKEDYINSNKLKKNFINDERHAINYLCESRINLNFRQVDKRKKDDKVD